MIENLGPSEPIIYPKDYFESSIEAIYPKTEEGELETDNYTFIPSPRDRRFGCIPIFVKRIPSNENDWSNLASHLSKQVGEEQDELLERGEPREQYNIVGENLRLGVYNYSESFKLSDSDVNRISDWVSFIRSRTMDELGQVGNIIIVDGSEKLWTGESANGHYSSELGGIVLFPTAFDEKNHRVEGVDNLRGVMSHEWAHQYLSGVETSSLYSDWAETGGWQITRDFKPGVSDDDQVEVTSRPDKCITEYSRHNSPDDFADYTVATLHNPDLAKQQSPEKYQFIVDNLLGEKPHLTKNLQNIRVDQPSVPSLPDEFYFRIFTYKE